MISERGSMSVEAMLVMSVTLVFLGMILVLMNQGFAQAAFEPADAFQEAFLEKADNLRFEQLMKLGR